MKSTDRRFGCGGTMVRYVHQEWWAAVLILVGVIGGWVGAGLGSPVREGAVAVLITGALGFLVLSTVLRASRLKWVGRLGEFEAATALPESDRHGHRAAFTPRMLGLLLLPALCVFVIRDAAIVVVLLAVGLDWLGRAVAGTCWERGGGRRLWLAPDPEEPRRLSYSPARPAPGAR
ncbi:hypothetical protein ABZT17_01750 [Streptomyces sp. NPDC005648]|uniref:hypothetical protein n=1 Tax=Streptomyces sp. NPDC005648 TaxID=3157044 RepID=UPI0033AB4DBC